MLSILRVTLLWLLALAVPAQGFAAATRLLCSAAHHGVGMGVASAAPGARVAPTASVDSVASAHAHHHPQVPSAAPAHQAESSHGTSHRLDHDSGRCTACAACCTAVALPTHVPALPGEPTGQATHVALHADGEVAFVTGGPDRPPRTRLLA